MSFAITGTNGTTNFTNVTAGTSYTLILYGMIQDQSTGLPNPNGNDGVNEFMAGVNIRGAWLLVVTTRFSRIVGPMPQ